MTTSQKIRTPSLNFLLLLFLCSPSNAQRTYPNNSRRSTLSRILAGCIVAIVIVSALLWYSQRQRRMRRNRPLIATTVPQNQNWAGGGPAPYQGFQSPGPSYNPPVGGYNESSSYPPNYAPPAYGKDAPGGFQPYPPPTGPPPVNQSSYPSVKHPAPAHVTGQDGTGSPWK